MTVSVRPTPNPDALMFRLDGATAVDAGMLAYFSAAEAQAHPLGAALFALDGVASILVVPAFVTVTKRPESAWDPLAAQVEALLTAWTEEK